MRRIALASAVLAASLSSLTQAAEPVISFTKLWTHGHTTAGQVSEIPAFDAKTNTVWVAGVVGVDVLNAATGVLVKHIDVTPWGYVNSVAIRDGIAAFAIEAAPDRRNAGSVVFFDTTTREPSTGVYLPWSRPAAYLPSQVTVGSLPDMLTFTPDGRKLLVANEATPNAVADTAYTTPDPAGSVTVIDVRTRTVIGTAGFDGVPQTGSNIRSNTGMDFEPEYITVDGKSRTAYVTLQEANAIGVLDLSQNAFSQVIGLGVKDFSLAGNEIDPKDNDSAVSFRSVAVKGLYTPDGVASYKSDDKTYLVFANEGDYREDNADRSTATSFGGTNPLDRLRVSNKDSSTGNLVTPGARSFSIRDTAGNIVYDSGNILETEANARGIYDDSRSRDKGVEPEGVAILKAEDRVFAFIGLERTTRSAVAVFDVTVPAESRFIDMIVTTGDKGPEGLAVYKYRGKHYLAIANETVATGDAATTSNTTLYRLDISETEQE